MSLLRDWGSAEAAATLLGKLAPCSRTHFPSVHDTLAGRGLRQVLLSALAPSPSRSSVRRRVSQGRQGSVGPPEPTRAEPRNRQQAGGQSPRPPATCLEGDLGPGVKGNCLGPPGMAWPHSRFSAAILILGSPQGPQALCSLASLDFS